MRAYATTFPPTEAPMYLLRHSIGSSGFKVARPISLLYRLYFTSQDAIAISVVGHLFDNIDL